MKIVYKKPDDATEFDLERYYKSLSRYGEISKDDIKKGIEALRNQFSDMLHVSCLVRLGVQLIPDEDRARLYWEEHSNNEYMGFERLRRITGYLVGSLNRWNDGKKAEERERVKHSIGQFTPEEKAEREEAKQVVLMEQQNEYHR